MEFERRITRQLPSSIKWGGKNSRTLYGDDDAGRIDNDTRRPRQLAVIAGRCYRVCCRAPINGNLILDIVGREGEVDRCAYRVTVRYPHQL